MAITIKFSACNYVSYTPCIVLWLIAGAYEPPKAAKDRETQFRDNPYYITIFENSDVICGFCIIETQQKVEVR